MTNKEYRKYTEADLIGKRVVTLRRIANGATSIPKGTTLTICGKVRGLKLESRPCPHCGVSLYVSRVNPEAVQLLSAEPTHD